MVPAFVILGLTRVSMPMPYSSPPKTAGFGPRPAAEPSVARLIAFAERSMESIWFVGASDQLLLLCGNTGGIR